MNNIEILKGIRELRTIFLENEFSIDKDFDETLENLLEELEINPQDCEGLGIELSFGEFDEDLIIELYEEMLYSDILYL